MTSTENKLHRDLPPDCANWFGRQAYCALPYLLTLTFPLAILAANPADLPPVTVIVRTIGLLLIFVALVDLVARLVLRRSPARELILCAVVVYLATYGYFDQVLLRHALAHRYALPLWSVLFLVLAVITWRNARRAVLGRIASFLQLSLVLLICIQTAWLGYLILPDAWRAGPTGKEHLMARESVPKTGPQELPDIYYVILDAYAGDDILRERYDYDNRDFLEALRKRGFLVGAQSRSNYSHTRWSLPSSLNMAYLDDLGLEAFKTNAALHELVNHNRVVRVLKPYGYTTVAFVTAYSVTECTSFDRYISTSFSLNEFENALFRMTPIAPVSFVFGSSTSSLKSSKLPLLLRVRRGRVLQKFAMLPEVTKNSPSPSFVFAHIIAPHQPFLFDANGDTVDPKREFSDGHSHTVPTKENRKIYVEGYREQLQFVNKKVLEVVDRILAESKRPPIIILQADHGPCSMLNDRSDNSYLRERFSILNAVYTPAGEDLGWHEGISPVNNFRVILDYYFNTDFGLLEDKCYFPKEGSSHVFIDVTEAVTKEATDHE